MCIIFKHVRHNLQTNSTLLHCFQITCYYNTSSMNNMRDLKYNHSVYTMLYSYWYDDLLWINRFWWPQTFLFSSFVLFLKWVYLFSYATLLTYLLFTIHKIFLEYVFPYNATNWNNYINCHVFLLWMKSRSTLKFEGVFINWLAAVECM